ncbi:MAG: ABC transporter ATP-binding protein [Cyanobacteriota bacterium]|nr:ABC transporter ATP-binding protein [Cyanobacteriota bacterium]
MTRGVVLENVYKSFRDRTSARIQPAPVAESGDPPGSVAVLRQINLTVRSGEFMVLVGPSGCGKSTLLRLMAGLESLTGGNIWVGDRLVNDLPPKQRDMAMVFQNYALYPHLTVYDNLAFGLRRMDAEKRNSSGLQDLGSGLLEVATRSLRWDRRYRSTRERKIEAQVRGVAQMLQIESLLDRLPKQLSGGQKQRVALGRAIARNPEVFLMDEPLSNLDAQLRTQTRGQIVQLQRQLGTTTIYVTHDRTEAMTMGDRIAVMDRGQIQQVASPLEVYNHPANRFVAEFMGSPPMNFFPVQVDRLTLAMLPRFRLTLPAQQWGKILQPYNGRSLLLGIRPEHLNLSVPANRNLQVRVDRVETLGSDTYLSASSIDLETPIPIQVRLPLEQAISPGDRCWLSLALDRIHLFDPDTEVAI